MHPYYLANIARYNAKNRIPIYIEEVKSNHPERYFHAHTFTELVLVTHGHAVHMLGDNKVPIKRGDLLIICPGMVHCYDETADFGIINLVYDQNKLSMPMLDSYEIPQILRFFPSTADNITEEEVCRPVGVVAEEHMEEFAGQMRKLQLELNSIQPGSNFLGMGLFMTFIANLARTVSITKTGCKSDISLANVIEYMHVELAKPLNMNELLKRAKMSRRSFFRIFKSLTGTTPQEFQTQLRLKLAVELLTTSNQSIGEISYRCGFSDSNYFGQVFKKYFKTSPRTYRTEHKVNITADRAD